MWIFSAPLYRALAQVHLFVLPFSLWLFVATDSEIFQGEALGALSVFAVLVAGIVLTLIGLRRRRIQLLPFMCLLGFIFYVAGLAEVTSDQSARALLISRYGMLVWLFAGTGFAVAVTILTQDTTPLRNRGVPILWGATILILTTIFLFKPSYLAYQSVSNWVIILVLKLLILAFHSRQTPIKLAWLGIVSCALLLLSGLNGSNVSLAALLVLPASVIVGLMILLRGRTRRWLVITCLIAFSGLIGVLWALVNNGLTRILLTADGTFFISSLSTRMELWQHFPAQLAVSPLTGHFAAEIAAGSGQGYYQHSLILSLLTHTGLIGSILVSLALYAIFFRAVFVSGPLRTLEILQVFLMAGILVVGAIATFFTWPPLWFAFGVLSGRLSGKLRPLRYP